MAGKRQHYIPRFLQRGFLAEQVGDSDRTWLHRRGTEARLVSLKAIGVSEYFYSKLQPGDVQTLDDLITSIEWDINSKLKELRNAGPGDISDSRIAASITSHLTLRTAHIRSIFIEGSEYFLDRFSEVLSNQDQLRDLMGVDNATTGPLTTALENELRSSPLSKLLPQSLATRILLFTIRESFGEFHSYQVPVIAKIFKEFMEELPTMVREGHNKALSKYQENEFEAHLAEMSWHTYAVEDAILPDCIALARNGTNSLSALTLRDNNSPDLVVFPIAHDLLLIGARKNVPNIDIDEINAASAACSDDFFIARNPCDSTLVNRIGKSCSLSIRKLVSDAISEISKNESRSPIPGPSADSLLPIKNSYHLSFSLKCEGFGDDELATKLVKVIQGVVTLAGRTLPLTDLDGLTFAADYSAAVEGLDRGDPALQPDRSRPRSYGQPVAKCIHVRRNGSSKSHIVLCATLAFALLDVDSDSSASALHTIIAMLAHVAHGTLYKKHLSEVPEIQFDVVSGQLSRASSSCPAMYFSSKASAFADELAGEKYSKLLLDSLHSAKQEVQRAIQIYSIDKSMEQLLSTALRHVSSVLDHAAEWLGHRDGLPSQQSYTVCTIHKNLKFYGLHDWIELFGRDLSRLYVVQDHYTAENLLSLSLHVERILWVLGVFPWPTEDGRLYVSLAPDT